MPESLGFDPSHHSMKAGDAIKHAIGKASTVDGRDQKMSYPPGTPEWKKAGSPRSTKTGKDIPTNTVLSPGEGGPEGVKAELVSPEATEERNEFSAKKIGTSQGGATDTYQMQDKTGQSGTPQSFSSQLPPSDEADPSSANFKQSSADMYEREAGKATAMGSEVADIQKKNLSDVMGTPNKNIAVKGGMGNKNIAKPEGY